MIVQRTSSYGAVLDTNEEATDASGANNTNQVQNIQVMKDFIS